MKYPTIYELEPIGVDGALEAVLATHFCSDACRDTYGRDPSTTAIGEDGDAEIIDGEVCNECGKAIDGSTDLEPRE